MKSKFLTTTCMLLLGAAPAFAQDSGTAPGVANGQKFGAWTVECQAIATNNTVCVLAQQLLRTSDRAFLAQVMAFQSAGGAQTYFSAQVPVGAYLPAGFAMRPASSDAIVELTWQSCTQTLCETLAQITPETLDALSANNETVIASYRPSLQSDPLIFNFSMVGAKEGLAALLAANTTSGTGE